MWAGVYWLGKHTMRYQNIKNEIYLEKLIHRCTLGDILKEVIKLLIIILAKSLIYQIIATFITLKF